MGAEWNFKESRGEMLVRKGGEGASVLMPSIGNGYASYVVDGLSLYVAGVYSGPAGALNPSHRGALRNFQGVLVGANVSAEALDLFSAHFVRRYAIQPGCEVTQVQYAHRVNRHLLMQTLEVSNVKGALKCAVSLSRLPSPTIDFTELQVRHYTNHSVHLYQILVPEVENGVKPLVGVATSDFSGVIEVQAGMVLQVPWITAIYTSMDARDPMRAAEKAYEEALTKVKALYAEHVAAWRKLYDSRLVISQDLRLIQVTNAAMYYMLSSMRDDWPWSISPGGLASDGYNGHIFWDAETWMYPPILTLWPHIAAGSILQYRLEHLNGAYAKARSYPGKNWIGAMFPWESAFSGIEVTPTWAPTGLLEQHITSDIAFASRQYFYATGDLNWLKKFFVVISGIADFWSSRVYYNNTSTSHLQPHRNIQATNGQILNVIPPDEYAVGVNNSIYTNFAAALACEWAVEAAHALGGGGIAPETIKTWTHVSRSLVLPFDSNKGIHLEYDGYAGQTIKQADVVLLGYPLEMKMPIEIRRNDLSYYEDRTDPNGPAMTWAMHAVGWLELGDAKRAEAMFVKGYANAQAPYYVWTETPTGGTTNFLTGAGGFLQSIINGYGGLRIRSVKAFEFNPSPPPPSVQGVGSKEEGLQQHFAMLGVSLCGSTFDVKWNATVISVGAAKFGTTGCKLFLSSHSEFPTPAPIGINQVYYLNIGSGPFTVTGD